MRRSQPPLSRPATILLSAVLVTAAVALVARAGESRPPLRPVRHVDLQRYMGDWRVISEIPYFAERGCVDSVEHYALQPDGTIANWFTYRKKSLWAPRRRIDASKVVVTNLQSNAEWQVRFLGGLIRAPYVVIDLDTEYRWTVVGHPSRNYGWIMARETQLPADTYRAILGRLAAQGYDPHRFQKVLQPVTAG